MFLYEKKVKQYVVLFVVVFFLFVCLFFFLSETIVVYDIKVGRCSQPNDFNFTSNLRMIKVW